jgi:hypothetical protein
MPDELLDPARAPREFIHAKCGGTSRMPDDMVAGYLANPHRFNDWAYCAKCDGYVPHRECRWAGSDEPLEYYFARLKAAVPAPPARNWLAFAAAPVLAVAGAAIGYAFAGTYGLFSGLLVGIGLGAAVLIAKLIGLK